MADRNDVGPHCANRRAWQAKVGAITNRFEPLIRDCYDRTTQLVEEAIYNAILKATTVESSRGRLTAIPLEETVKILKKYNALDWDKSLPPTVR